MKKQLLTAFLFLIVITISCKKHKTVDLQSKYVGNWAGAQQIVGISNPLKFSLQINSDNTVINIDSAYGNQVFPGTYTYTTDSLKINYSNGTKWSVKLNSQYTVGSGTVLGAQGAIGTVSMTKK